MSAFARLFHLPLLAKELLEQAARPRTYWMRVAYGGLLYLVVVLPQLEFFKSSGNPRGVLGQGRELFDALVGFQFAGIFFFLPALMSGRITMEKERASLALLLLTELSPAQIVLQKFFAGLVPMLTFLLLGLPLAAVAYAFGGFPPGDLALAAVTLLLCCLQVGAIALWCSALYRTTVGAFIGTYAIGAAFYLGPAVILTFVDWIGWVPSSHIDKAVIFMHVPPAAFEEIRSDRLRSVDDLRFFTAILASTTFFLWLAIHHLPRKAFAPPTRFLKRLFEFLDRVAQRVNRRLGNVVLGRRTNTLPDDAPVLWREKRSRLMGRPAYLVRLLVAVEVPVVLIALSATVSNPYSNEQYALSVLAACAGTFGVLVLTVVAANAFANERSSQTLDVLLTTPLTAREIVRQKARSLRGLVLVIAIPLLSVFAYEALLESIVTGPPFIRRPDRPPDWLYGVCVFLTVAIYLPLVSWLSLWIGLIQRSRLRAIVTALVAIVGWCALPPMILGGVFDFMPQGAQGLLFLTSPVMLPAANEFHGLGDFARGAPWLPVLVNFSGYAVILYVIRDRCLSRADEYLRR